MTDYSFTTLPLEMWIEWARRDDWHQRFVGSDIRQLIGEVQRLDRDAFTWRLTSSTMGSSMDAFERAKRAQSTRDAEAAIIEWCARIAAHHSPEAGKAIIDAGRVDREQPVAPATHAETSKMVADFAIALLAKLGKAEEKYGYRDNWRTDDWEDECRAQLMRHIDKGDPLDVAAYAAFMWRRGWSTSAISEAPK